jgi:hypothetical protein
VLWPLACLEKEFWQAAAACDTLNISTQLAMEGTCPVCHRSCALHQKHPKQLWHRLIT